MPHSFKCRFQRLRNFSTLHLYLMLMEGVLWSEKREGEVGQGERRGQTVRKGEENEGKRNTEVQAEGKADGRKSIRWRERQRTICCLGLLEGKKIACTRSTIS